jgi:serine/threonine-protein kinase
VDKALEQRVVGATVAGKYRIRKVVGHGSMGVVCEAEHLEIGKRLAIKIIDASLAGMKDIALRFRQEARAASLVENQHIVQVFDVGTDEALGLYLVMEYLVGEDLAAVLARQGRLEPDAAVSIAVQAARGLAKAHEAGVIHRDLKPANIFLVEREEDEPLVKILDFGISKVAGASRTDSQIGLTRAGTVVGTPQYMSPEQAQGNSVDERTDVWALGLVLYEMLAGRPAYPELHTYEAFIIRLVSRPPDPLSVVAPWVPAALAAVVHQAASHDLSERIPKAAILAQLLTIAHPLPGARGVRLVAADTADTWSDDSTRSPYADGGPNEPPAPAESALCKEASVAVEVESLTAIMSRKAPEGLGVAKAIPVARGALAAPDDVPEDFEDDAPQFFDRRELDTLAPPPPAPSRDEAHEAQRSETPRLAREPRAAARPHPTPRAPSARLRLPWLAVAFITLGLAVVAMLAMR